MTGSWNWTLAQRLALGYAFSGLTLLIVAFVGYRTTQTLIDNDHWVEHTHLVREHIATLTSGLAEAETAERGFVITAQDQYLAPYDKATADVKAAYGELRRLTQDNSVQQRRLDAILPLVEERISLLNSVIELCKQQGSSAAAAVVKGGRGRELTHDVRALLGEMKADEQRLLAERSLDAEASAQTARNVILWCSIVGAVLVALVGALIARALTRQIGSAVRHIQSSSTELQAAANQQATSAKEQATAMSEITMTISELLATAKQIAESARRVAGIADDTTRSAQSGDKVVQRTNESIVSIQRQVDAIVTHMLDLGRKSQQIGSILELINELAEQTNILAINATIDAAGAGENGKRFAVVAEEIRRLSDRVGASTKEIRQLIEDIRSAVNKTVMTTEGGNKAVEAGARQFTEVTASFGQIVGLLSTTSDAAREIELSTKQQSTAVEQVNVAVANVAQATRETEASSGQTLQTASELASLSRELLKVVRARVAA